MIRLIGNRPDPNRNYTLRPGVYAILPSAGGVLLTLQSAPRPELQLPGGGVDAGESPLNALHREVFEETGWRIARPRRLGAFRRFVYMPEYAIWAEKLCAVYVAHPVRAVSEPVEPEHSAVFLPPDKATRVLANAGDRMFMRRYFG